MIEKNQRKEHAKKKRAPFYKEDLGTRVHITPKDYHRYKVKEDVRKETEKYVR